MPVSLAEPDPGEARRTRFVRRMVLLNLIALAAAYMSGHWDAAMHARGEVERFWYPPHYGIYFGLAVAAGVSLVGFVSLLRAPGTLGTKIRRHAALATIAGANAIGFAGAPFDAWWHEAFGVDLSVWSPPHLHLLFGMVLAALAGSVYFLDDGSTGRGLRAFSRPGPRSATAMAAVVIGLLLAAFLFFEYEAGLPNADVLGRPRWTYPVLWTAFAVFAVLLPAALFRMRGAATLVAGAYVLVRLAVLGIDRSLLGFAGAAPYPLILPALAVDAVLSFTATRRLDAGSSVVLMATGLLASVVVVVTAPPMWAALDVVPALTADPWTTAWPAAVGSGVVGAFAGWRSGTALRRLRPDHVPTRAPVLRAEPA